MNRDDNLRKITESTVADSRVLMGVTRLSVEEGIAAEVLATADLRTVLDQVRDRLAAKLTARVLSDRIMERSYSTTVHVPANPWQHFKNRFGPGWFVRRWPVRSAPIRLTVAIDVDAEYPAAQVHLNEDRLGPPIFYEQGSVMLDLPDQAAPSPAPAITYATIRRTASAARLDLLRDNPDPYDWSRIYPPRS